LPIHLLAGAQMLVMNLRASIKTLRIGILRLPIRDSEEPKFLSYTLNLGIYLVSYHPGASGHPHPAHQGFA